MRCGRLILGVCGHGLLGQGEDMPIGKRRLDGSLGDLLNRH